MPFDFDDLVFCVWVCVRAFLNDSALKAEILCFKKKPIFFLRELYFIRLTLDNWIAENDSSFVDVCIHGYVCVCTCILDLGVLPQENVRIRWDYKDTLSLLDYKVVLLLSD